MVFRTALGQEADPLGERDVCWEPLSVGRQAGKLRELELAPGVRIKPLRVVAPRGVEGLSQLSDVVGMSRMIIDGGSLPTLNLPAARDHVEKAHGVVAFPHDPPAAV